MSILRDVAVLIWKLTPSRQLRGWYFSVYCWLVRGKARVVEVDGVRLELDLSQIIDVAVLLQRFERELVDAIHAHTKSGDVVLDIGANAGVHSMVLAKCAWPGKVIAFEPTQYAHARLERNIALNPNLHVVPQRLALSDENASSRVASFRSSWRTDRINDTKPEPMCFRRLDDWLAENHIDKVNLVKLDVDGFEYQVLRGASKMLANSQPILFMEVGHWHFDSDQTNPILLLSNIGYRFWDAKSLEAMLPEQLRRRMQAPQMLDVTINVIASTSKTFAPCSQRRE